MTSRYRTRLVPQGVIPKDLNIGIRLTPLGVPPPIEGPEAPPPTPPPCVVECGSLATFGWTSSGGAATPVSGSNAATVNMQGGPWTMQITVNEATPNFPPFCGGSVTLEFSGDLIEGTDYVVANSGTSAWLFGMKGCDPPYAGGLTVQAKLDGVNFCDPLNYFFSGDGGGCGAISCCFDSISGDPCTLGPLQLEGTGTISFGDIGPNAGVGPLYWNIVNSGTEYGIVITINTTDNINYTVGPYDSTFNFGSQWNCYAFLDPELTIPYCELPVIIFGNDNS